LAPLNIVTPFLIEAFAQNTVGYTIAFVCADNLTPGACSFGPWKRCDS